jgi:hypothetical protein
VAGASVGKASKRFFSLKSGFCLHRPGRNGRFGGSTAQMTRGAGFARPRKQRPSPGFQGHNAKIITPGHGPPGPGLTNFDDVRTGWAEIRDEEDSFMQGWRWRWSLPVVAAAAVEAGRGCAGRGKKHDVTTAGTEDFRLVREMQHYVARPQELPHPGITFPRGRAEPAVVPDPREPTAAEAAGSGCDRLVASFGGQQKGGAAAFERRLLLCGG